MAEEQKLQFTPEGLAELKAELNKRKTVIAGEIAKQLEEARAQGDLSENSEYDEAKDAQAKNGARILEIEEILKNAEVIDDSEISKTKVSLGSVVVLRDEETKEETQYELVNAISADIFSNKISQDSPVGKAIIGKKKGQVIEVQTAVGSFKYKIMKIGKKED
ncbi:MAG: transcription elongation factor GreA [Clostridiales bacterium]|nr:transcription elongation factor GreA [Clostridiales bacterium]